MKQGPVLSRYTLDQIGKGLRAHYDKIEWQPLPASIYEPLQRLDVREKELAAVRA